VRLALLVALVLALVIACARITINISGRDVSQNVELDEVLSVKKEEEKKEGR
jgi:hypothetical protein